MSDLKTECLIFEYKLLKLSRAFTQQKHQLANDNFWNYVLNQVEGIEIYRLRGMDGRLKWCEFSSESFCFSINGKRRQLNGRQGWCGTFEQIRDVTLK